MSRLMLLAVVAAAILAATTTARVAAGASSAVTIVETTTQRVPTVQGTFTATGPLCPGGTFTNKESAVTVFTTLTCTDGSGTFTLAAANNWRVDSGTSRYAKLWGQGTFTLVQLPDGNVVETLSGQADFDTTPPTAAFGRVTVTKRRAASRAYVLHVRFTASDNDAPSVGYRLSAVVGSRRFAGADAYAGHSAITTSVPVRAAKGVHKVTVVLALLDATHNGATLGRTVRLPG
jgi:hypothetical protein